MDDGWIDGWDMIGVESGEILEQLPTPWAPARSILWDGDRYRVTP